MPQDRPDTEAPSQTNQLRTWIARIIGILLLAAAISTHFFTSQNEYTPEVRSARRKPEASQFRGKDIASIEREVRELWGKLEAMMTEAETKQFQPPASEEEIQSLEQLLGAKLPPDFRAYLKIHNGSTDYRNCLYQTPLSIRRMKRELEHMHSFIDPQRPMNRATKDHYNQNFWRPGLILFAESDGAGPAIDCSTGEVVNWDHDGWSFRVVAPNFTEFLRRAVEESRPGELYW